MTPEDVIKNYRDTLAGSGYDPVQLEVNILGLEDLMKEKDPTKLAAKSFDLLATHRGDPELGAAVCQALLTNEEHGKKVACEVGKQMTALEFSDFTPGGEQFLRSKHSVVGFSKEFITQTSPNAEKDIRQQMDNIGKKYNLAKVDKEGTPQEKTETIENLGKDFQKLMGTPPLSEDSLTYIKAIRSAVLEDKDFVNRTKVALKCTDEEAQKLQKQNAEIVVNNSTVLRFTSPMLAMHSNRKSEAWREATKAVQKSFNFMGSDTLTTDQKLYKTKVGQDGKITTLTEQEINGNKLYDQAVQKIHDARGDALKIHTTVEEAPDHTAMNLDLAKGYATSSEERANTLKDRTSTAKQRMVDTRQRETEQLEATIKPERAKLKQLEDKLKRLQEGPSGTDKIKAFFKGGFNTKKGLQQEKTDLIDQIDQTKLEIMKKVDYNTFQRMSDQESASKRHLQESKDNMDLEATLKYDALKQPFEKFAKEQGYGNQVAFLKEVKELQEGIRNGDDLGDLQVKAFGICSRYVDQYADQPIGLDPEKRDQLSKAVDIATSGKVKREDLAKLFDPASNVIEAELTTNVFSKFKTTDAFKKGLEDVEKNVVGFSKAKQQIDGEVANLERNQSVRNAVFAKAKAEKEKQGQVKSTGVKV